MKTQARDFSKLMDDAGAYRQQVRMAAVQVAGLKPDELAQALAYEVEPFSGIPATEADILYKPIADPDPTIRVYDVSVKRRKRAGIRSGSRNTWLRCAIIFACLVTVGLTIDGIERTHRKAALTQAVRARRPLQAQLDRLNGEIRLVQADVRAIRSRREAAERAQDEAATLRMAYADVLDELAMACGEQAVITSLKPIDETLPPHVRVQGVALSAESASDAMRRLTEHAVTRGWQLTPGSISTSGSGATATFSFNLNRK